MSDVVPEMPDDGGATAPPYSRFTIYLRCRDTEGQEIPHVLGQLRSELTRIGFPGRLVIRKIQGDYNHLDTEDLDMIMIDTPDTEENRNAIFNAAKMAKDMAGHTEIHVTVSPIESYIL